MSPQVFVSGCFDLLHAGHLQFLESAARFGALIVAVGSDRTITELKGKSPVTSEDERLRVVRSLRMVSDAFIARGAGMLDFADELREIRPNVFVVNEDGHAACKGDLCRELGIEYVVLKREPPAGSPERSTSQLRAQVAIPYRVDLAGGWLDQPFVSSLHAGPVIVASVEVDQDFDERSGMATSTRETAKKLWGQRLPPADPLQTALLLFGAENPPGKEPIAGSQDALGIVLPGVSRLHYDGGYWPTTVDSIVDDAVLNWLAPLLWLYPLGARAGAFDVFAGRDITSAKAARLAEAAERAWRAIEAQDADSLGQAVWDSFQAQLAMFPAMTNSVVEQALRQVRRAALGCKLTGAGGGGYLLLVARHPPPGCRGLRLRRQMF
jgi:cytidyltransferase-like protein